MVLILCNSISTILLFIRAVCIDDAVVRWNQEGFLEEVNNMITPYRCRFMMLVCLSSTQWSHVMSWRKICPLPRLYKSRQANVAAIATSAAFVVVDHIGIFQCCWSICRYIEACMCVAANCVNIISRHHRLLFTSPTESCIQETPMKDLWPNVSKTKIYSHKMNDVCRY